MMMQHRPRLWTMLYRRLYHVPLGGAVGVPNGSKGPSRMATSSRREAGNFFQVPCGFVEKCWETPPNRMSEI